MSDFWGEDVCGGFREVCIIWVWYKRPPTKKSVHQKKSNSFSISYTEQRWSFQGSSCPRGHLLKSLALALISTSPRKCPVLGWRTVWFFNWLKWKITKHKISWIRGIGLTKTFDWRPQTANHKPQYDVIKNFRTKEFFMGQKYFKMEDPKSPAWVSA